MSFILDKPMIVRIVPVLYALLGTFMLYVALTNISTDALFSIECAGLGVFSLICLYLVQSRKWYSWHVSMVSFLLFAAFTGIVYMETNDTFWLLILLIDLMIIVAWSVKFTRQYFDAAS